MRIARCRNNSLISWPENGFELLKEERHEPGNGGAMYGFSWKGVPDEEWLPTKNPKPIDDDHGSRVNLSMHLLPAIGNFFVTSLRDLGLSRKRDRLHGGRPLT